MKWDEVEREFIVIGTHLERLSKAFMALGLALNRERNSDSVRSMTGVRPPGQTNKSDLEGPEGPSNSSQSNIFD